MKFVGILLLTAAVAWLGMALTSIAGTDATESNIYEVIVGANLRAEPSIEGRWLAVVPEGALVVRLGDDVNGYSLIEYQETKGYIFTGCIKLAESDAALKLLEGAQEERAQVVEAVAVARESQRIDRASRDRGSASMMNGMTAIALVSQSVSSTREETAQGSRAQMPVELAVTAGVNFRRQATASSERIALVQAGETVTFLDAGENGFYHVSYQGTEGYLYSKCVDSEELLRSGRVRAREDGAYEAAPMVAQRSSSASRSSRSAVLAIAQGSLQGGGSASVRTTAQSALVQETVVQTTQPVETVASAATQPVQRVTRSAVTPPINYQIGVMTRLTRTPDVNDEIYVDLPSGASVNVLDRAGGYAMVQYDGLTGYVPDGYVLESVDYARMRGQAVLFTVTAYCPCQICCGNYSPEVTGGEPHTSTGTVPVAGRTIAVDPGVIPYGSRVSIEGLGTYIAEDCGGLVNDNHIDIYFNTHEEALAFGRQYLYVTVLE